MTGRTNAQRNASGVNQHSLAKRPQRSSLDPTNTEHPGGVAVPKMKSRDALGATPQPNLLLPSVFRLPTSIARVPPMGTLAPAVLR